MLPETQSSHTTLWKHSTEWNKYPCDFCLIAMPSSFWIKKTFSKHDLTGCSFIHFFSQFINKPSALLIYYFAVGGRVFSVKFTKNSQQKQKKRRVVQIQWPKITLWNVMALMFSAIFINLLSLDKKKSTGFLSHVRN